MELNKIDPEKLKTLVQDSLAASGITGNAGVDCRYEDGVIVHFTRHDGVECGISGGARLANHRTEEQLAEIFQKQMVEWYARADAGEFDEPEVAAEGRVILR